jgi:hypothetical protein
MLPPPRDKLIQVLAHSSSFQKARKTLQMHDVLLFSLKSFHMFKDKSILLLKCSLERKLDEQTLMNHYLVLVHLLSISFGSHF